MANFLATHLRAVLKSYIPRSATGLLVAISGGMDSACLLTAVAQLTADGRLSAVTEVLGTAGVNVVAPLADVSHDAVPFRGLPVRAVHVDHGLQPAAAAEFRAVCADLCRRLDIPLEVIAVAVDATAGISIEAAAREARYRGIAEQLRPGECLLTAHHAQDQAETLLLQLLRGAGLKGLSAMPICKVFGAGWHLRPLLEVAKRDLLEFAKHARLTAVSDPMNIDLRFDRAYLRARLWPPIEERWPGAAITVSRTARHLAEAQELLDRSAAVAVDKLRDGNALSVTGLRGLPADAQRNALRYWIAASPARTLPPTARLTEALRQIIDADDDHLPTIVWGEHALRRYRERLFLTPANPPCVREPLEWALAAARLELGGGLGTLRWSPQIGGLDMSRLPPTLIVRRRRGGETLKPNRRARTQSVQHLCQSLGVLPWMRDALPLIYAGETLIAIGDLWLDARWCVAGETPGLRCIWEDAPILV